MVQDGLLAGSMYAHTQQTIRCTLSSCEQRRHGLQIHKQHARPARMNNGQRVKGGRIAVPGVGRDQTTLLPPFFSPSGCCLIKTGTRPPECLALDTPAPTSKARFPARHTTPTRCKI